MRNIIETGLPTLKQPFSWAVEGNGILFTAHGPVKADGTIELGPIESQTHLTFHNLQQTLLTAKSNMESVLQVLIYLIHAEDAEHVDKIYMHYFKAPYPNRSTLIVQKLVVPDMRIEISVTALAYTQ